MMLKLQSIQEVMTEYIMYCGLRVILDQPPVCQEYIMYYMMPRIHTSESIQTYDLHEQSLWSCVAAHAMHDHF